MLDIGFINIINIYSSLVALTPNVKKNKFLFHGRVISVFYCNYIK